MLIDSDGTGWKTRYKIVWLRKRLKKKSDTKYFSPLRLPSFLPHTLLTVMAIPESRATRNRAPAYLASSPTSPLNSNLTLYSAIAAAPKSLVYSHILPIRSGHAWTVPAGSTCRITTPEGPQVGDLNLWNLHNPRERFWASRTRQLHRSHVTTLDRLWSCLPYLRPMVTIIEDSLGDYGVDEVGGRCHDLLGTRCDPYGRFLVLYLLLVKPKGREIPNWSALKDFQSTKCSRATTSITTAIQIWLGQFCHMVSTNQMFTTFWTYFKSQD